MRKFYLIWLLVVTLCALIAAAVQSTFERSRLSDESDAQAAAMLMTIEDPVAQAYQARRFSQIARTMHRLQKKVRVSSAEAVAGLAICSSDPGEVAQGFPNGSGWQSVCPNSHVSQALKQQKELSWDVRIADKHLRYTARPFPTEDAVNRVLVLARDVSYLKDRWIQSFTRNFAVYWISSLILLFLIANQVSRWIQHNLRILTHSLRSLIAGKRPKNLIGVPSEMDADLHPINKELDELANKIRVLTRSQEGKVKEKSWLAELTKNLEHRELLVVANREPYIHQKKNGKIEVMRPASGLVTALEPILRQCGGTWIAHGSGSADRETSDAQGMVAVPPGHPSYQLKRVWLTPEEEEGYYYGFSNEGLWPLCHLAHTRPIFRLSDWDTYQKVNQKFCDSIPLGKFQPSSVFLVQDYHLALLPQMMRQAALSKGKGAPKVGLFWHIPWPNPEAFGICPWNADLLKGMLGSDVVGFHTQYHCNNFLETCNRYLEARIDYERFSVTMENHETFVRAVPIGIDTAPIKTLSDTEVAELKKKYGIFAEKVAVGVDRLDYTKGLVERIEAVERFLEKNPEWIGRFTLAQMGSPSRTQIPAYQELARRLDETVNRVNTRFAVKDNEAYKAVLLLSSHHEWSEIQYFYQIGDVCMVTSLHDGMNLVAKEYIWCQSVKRGSLILSKFAGASRELTESFIVNPYSIEEMADAIAQSLALAPEEREQKMRSMKEKVQSRSAFHWASDLIRAVTETSSEPGSPLHGGPNAPLNAKLENAPVAPINSGRTDKSKLAKAL